MNRSTAVLAMFVASFVGAGGSTGAMAFAGDAVCDRLQSQLSERDQEVARHGLLRDAVDRLDERVGEYHLERTIDLLARGEWQPVVRVISGLESPGFS